MQNQIPVPRVAIACGGTGGHLFPGLAVAGQLREYGCAVTLLVSPKDIDKKALAANGNTAFSTATLPAVGFTGNPFAFARGFLRSFLAARKLFHQQRPDAVLAMGGFTAAPPALAGRLFGAPIFLHESNSIPGKANRWLSHFARTAFVGFPQAADRLHTRQTKVTGTPVRSQFHPADARACRRALGLNPENPVLLVTGGSQGASGVNRLVISALPLLAKSLPDLQIIFLTGPNDEKQAVDACAAAGFKAVVHSFFAEMPLALGAASVAISRAGASSLAELAAMRVPAILIPYPAATDDHQFFNAEAWENTGAARLLVQASTTPEVLAKNVLELIQNPEAAKNMCAAIGKWHKPQAAKEIAENIMQAITARRAAGSPTAAAAPGLHQHHSALT